MNEQKASGWIIYDMLINAISKNLRYPCDVFNVCLCINVMIQLTVTEEWHFSHSVAQPCISAEMEMWNIGFKCHLLLSENKNANLCFFYLFFLIFCCGDCCLCGAFSTGNVKSFFFPSFYQPYPCYSARFWPAHNRVKDIRNGSYLIDMTSLGLGKYIYYPT